MRYAGSILVLLLLVLTTLSPLAAYGAVDVEEEVEAESTPGLDPQELTATTAILMDAQTGQVLYEKQGNRQMFPASTTKVLTCLLALEMLDLDDMLTVSSSAVADITQGESNIALTPGEQLSVQDALYALMLFSANDAANVLAEQASGSQEEFAQLMTQRARDMGALGTNFTNAHGLHDPGHYTTAYDMAVLTRNALRNPGFLDYFGTGRYTMGPTNKQPEERPFTNYQWMLLPDMWVYSPSVIGGKTGYTHEARSTMTSAATQDGRTLIAVVFQTGADEKFYDTQMLFDLGFDEYVKHTIPADRFEQVTVPIFDSGEAVGDATFYAGDDLDIWLHEDVPLDNVTFVYDFPESFEQGDAVSAHVTLRLEGSTLPGMPKELLTKELSADISLQDIPAWTTEMEGATSSPFSFDFTQHLYIPIIILAVSGVLLVVALLGFRAYRQHQRIKARRDRLQRRLQEYKKAS